MKKTYQHPCIHEVALEKAPLLNGSLTVNEPADGGIIETPEEILSRPLFNPFGGLDNGPLGQ